MPEIPEMEHYREMMNQSVIFKQISGVRIDRPKSINSAPELFSQSLLCQKIEEISRRAKYLVMRLTSGRFLLTHMMLDGRIYYGQTGQSDGISGTPHVVLELSDGNSLYFCGLTLGFLHLLTLDQLENGLAELGLEPLSSGFTRQSLIHAFRGRRGAIKPLLMDQKLVAGIGNAYSNEILFRAGILPDRKVAELGEIGFQTLWEVIPKVLQEGIENGGYIEEPYARWDTRAGGQNLKFMVYDRGNMPCRVCGTIIRQTKQNGRWTYFCSVCQT